MGWFCPEQFELSAQSIEWAKKKGLTTDIIEDQLDEMRDCEFKREYADWDRVFRNWIRRGIRWGNISPPRKPRRVEELSEEQRNADILAFERDPLIRKALGK